MLFLKEIDGETFGEGEVGGGVVRGGVGLDVEEGVVRVVGSSGELEGDGVALGVGVGGFEAGGELEDRVFEGETGGWVAVS